MTTDHKFYLICFGGILFLMSLPHWADRVLDYLFKRRECADCFMFSKKRHPCPDCKAMLCPSCQIEHECR